MNNYKSWRILCISTFMECTQLITSESHGEKVLKLFVASKRLENCADGGDGTVSRYAECVAKMIEYLHKRFEDITTNDI